MKNSNNKNILERSVNSLQWFYTVVLSLAVVNSIQQIIKYDIVNLQATFNLEYLHNFIVFLVIVIPFHQGANRYLDETYINEKLSLNLFTGLIDFLFFFIEGMVFYTMSIFMQNNTYFYISTMVVFGVDVIWLCYVYFANETLFKKVKSWLYINSSTIIIIFLFMIIKNCIDQNLKWYFLAFILFIRTILDYRFAWPFYWPGFYRNRDKQIN